MDLEMHMDEYLPLRDVVFNTLRKAILKGDLKPGERLMEIALAEKLGVSRTPIREAIRKLELDELDKVEKKFSNLIDSENLTELAEVDVEFHDIIYAATNNKRLIQLLNNLREQMYRYRIEYLKDSAVRRQLAKEHKSICEALRTHDKESALRYVYVHIDNQQKAIIRSLNEEKEE